MRTGNKIIIKVRATHDTDLNRRCLILERKMKGIDMTKPESEYTKEQLEIMKEYLIVYDELVQTRTRVGYFRLRAKT